MCGSPLGYGSISSTYIALGSDARSFDTSQAPSSAQTFCHLASISAGSYRPAMRLQVIRGCAGTGFILSPGILAVLMAEPKEIKDAHEQARRIRHDAERRARDTMEDARKQSAAMLAEARAC